MSESEQSLNTNRELWREPPGDYYSNSVHVTASGGLGIQVNGTVHVRTLKQWHELEAAYNKEKARLDWLESVRRNYSYVINCVLLSVKPTLREAIDAARKAETR